jgi:hypothetical protein
METQQKRKEYREPQLIEHGSLIEIVQTGTGSKSGDYSNSNSYT